MQQSQRVYMLRCVWAVGRLGVAAWLACVAAAAVDRQARQSCRVWCGGVNWVGPTARQVRSASECVRRSHRQCLRRPTHSDAERTCQLTSHHHTRHDKTVLSVSRLVCRCELDDCSERVQTSNFLSVTVLSCRESNSHRRSGRDADKTVLSCMATVWIGFYPLFWESKNCLNIFCNYTMTRYTIMAIKQQI